MLEELSDLSALVQLFRRPLGPLDRTRYREHISFQNSVTRSPVHLDFEGTRVLKSLLLALYGAGRQSVPVVAAEEADAPLFSVWSQQWPRLRRNFRFQTAVTRHIRSAPLAKFDTYLQLVAAEDISPKILNSEWVESAVHDIEHGPGGFLRSFLWQYGNDVRKQRGSFRPLVRVALLHRSNDAGVGTKILKLVTEAFPDRNDAVALKQDIIDGALIPHAQLDVMWFVLAHGGREVFPPPSELGILRLAQLWPNRPQDLLHLAERTADAAEALDRSIFETITRAVPTNEFWTLTAAYPRVRERMVMSRPALLTSDAVSLLDNGSLVCMIELVPQDNSIGHGLIPKVLIRDDSRLVDVLIDRFPEVAAAEVIAAFANGSAVSAAWLRGLIKRPDVLLDPAVMQGISHTSLLYEIAERLGWLSYAVVDAGTQPWTSALAKISNDLPDDKHETLEAFLVGLGLLCGGDGGRQLLEQFFNRVHNLVLKGRLPWGALNILSPCLPDVGWIRGWDFGLRLRLAVATCYVKFDYPPESYAALSISKKVRVMLAEAAGEVDGAERFAHAANY